MRIINDRSVFDDHFSNVSSASASPPVKISPSPNRNPNPTLPTPPHFVKGSNKGGSGTGISSGTVSRIGSGSGNNESYHGGHPPYNRGGYGGYGYSYPVAVPVEVPVAVAVPDSVPAPDASKDSMVKATPIDMMGVLPYGVFALIGGIGGYLIADKKQKNVWHGAGIGAGVLAGGLFLFNYASKK